MKKTFSITILFCLTQFAFAQQTLPFYDNFEGANNWTIVNGTQTNKWFIDTATFVSSNHSIYISDNGGTTNMYSNSSSITHFYADFIATQSGCVTLEFDWKCLGEPGFDFMSLHFATLPIGMLQTVNPHFNVFPIGLQNVRGHGLDSFRAINHERFGSACDPGREDKIGIANRMIRMKVSDESTSEFGHRQALNAFAIRCRGASHYAGAKVD